MQFFRRYTMEFHKYVYMIKVPSIIRMHLWFNVFFQRSCILGDTAMEKSQKFVVLKTATYNCPKKTVLIEVNVILHTVIKILILKLKKNPILTILKGRHLLG